MRPFPSLRIVLQAAVLSAAVAAARPAPLDAQPGNAQLERARRIVVMVDARFADGIDETASYGAGVVVGASMGRIYIATANHVVRQGDQVAGQVRVKFRDLPAEEFTARVLALHDPGLDYALLMVNDRQADAVVNALPFRILRSAPLAAGVPVVHVGQPNGAEWRVNVTPAAVSRVSGSTLLFQSSSLAPGYSGGGLFDGDGALVGLVTQDVGTDARAIRIDQLVSALQDEGIQVSLAAAAPEPSPTAGGEGRETVASAAMIGPLRLEMTRCVREGTSLHCRLFLYTTESGRFGITADSEGIDNNGNTYYPRQLQIANQSQHYRLDMNLAAEVRTPAIIVFHEVPPNTREISLLRLYTRFENHDWRMVPFRNIPVQTGMP